MLVLAEIPISLGTPLRGAQKSLIAPTTNQPPFLTFSHAIAIELSCSMYYMCSLRANIEKKFQNICCQGQQLCPFSDAKLFRKLRKPHTYLRDTLDNEEK